MTHPSVNSIVERLPELPDNHADVTPDLAMKIMEKYREIIGQRDTIISELQAERDESNRRWNERCVEISVNAHGWMKAHDQLLGFIQSRSELLKALIEEKFAIKYPSPADVPEILQRALTAESSLSRIKAETIEEVITAVEQNAFQIMLDVVNEWHRQVGIDDVMKSKLTQKRADTVATGVFKRSIASAIRSLGSTGEMDSEKTAQSKHSPWEAWPNSDFSRVVEETGILDQGRSSRSD